jgi:hypothetical protein
MYSFFFHFSIPHFWKLEFSHEMLLHFAHYFPQAPNLNNLQEY